MTTAELQRIIEVMRAVRDDAEADVNALDGKPFNGKTVGEQFGNTNAGLAAVAAAVRQIAEEMLERRRDIL